MPTTDTPDRSGKSLASLNILLVDDNKFVITLLTDVLKNALGVGRVIPAHSVASAHAAARAATVPIDCVICDQVMPDATGLEFLKVIRRGQIGQLRADIPFIVCTSSDDLRVAAAAEQLGVTAYIKKPATEEALRDALQQACRRDSQLESRQYDDVKLPIDGHDTPHDDQ